MQEVAGLVSVIIPAYNAEDFLAETIDSVKTQTYSNWEIIVVNDGSADGTSRIVNNETDARIRLIEQKNAGVSVARNNGLGQAKGEYVIFFDADDLMTPAFIEVRKQYLDNQPALGFAGGLIESFPVKSIIKKAVANNPEKEILFFDSTRATIPSNYMFRRKVLLEYDIRFSTRLSSTADRFFILQTSKHTTGKGIEEEKGKLMYRVSEKSMSHHITPKLILDNVQFYKELENGNLMPVTDRAKFKSGYFYSLALGFAKVKYYKSCFKYLFQSFFSSPLYFIKLVLKQLTFKK
jgi:glycosyltransferase involved in cell wall biosynthesis